MKDTTPAAHDAPNTDLAKPVFYWELPPVERQVLRDEHRGLAEEGYLAIDINFGRRLVAIPCAYEDWPDVEAQAPGYHIERYSDAIACILHAAQRDGFETDEVLDHAIHTHASTIDTSTYAANYRNRTTR